MYKYDAATYVDVHQAALMKRGTPKACIHNICDYIYYVTSKGSLKMKQAVMVSF